MLKEIVNRHQNNANCKKYHSKYEKLYGKALPPCKFKDHPGLIQNLLDCAGEVEEFQIPFVSDESDSKESDSEGSDSTQDAHTEPDQSVTNLK